MMHSSPMPLMIALDLVKRMHRELARHLTPEQKRDFARVERLIAEAQQHHQTELSRLSQPAIAKDPAEPAPRRLRLWG